MTDADPRQQLADAFDRDLDPLAAHAETFEREDVDPFAVFEAERLATRDLSDAAMDEYDRTFRQWRAFMADQGRHPACPNETHVRDFIAHLRDDRDHAAGTIQNRLIYLGQAYGYWQEDAAFPHPQDYNPVDLAKQGVTLDDGPAKEPPRVTLDELRDVIEAEVTHVRDRAIVILQLKLGLRATEVCNLKLAEVDLANRDVQAHYDDLGSVRALENRSNAVYVPHDRPGNKSRRPRLLPLDDETRRVLLRWLLVRPDNGEPWLFLSKNQRTQLRRDNINDIWTEAFQPAYAETADHRAVTSHFGRHYFTTYWRVDQDVNRELVKYMRGDTAGSARIEDRGAIDEYVHTYYEDVEALYRENVFKLGL
jgi:integrase/recombinase XerD